MKNIFISSFIIIFFITTLALIDPSIFILISTSITAILITISFNLLLLFFIFQSLQQHSYTPLLTLIISFIFLLVIASIYTTVEAFSTPTFSLVALLALPLEILGVGYYLGIYHLLNNFSLKNKFNFNKFSLILFTLALPFYLLNIFLAIPVY